jgi:MFS transporter, ACS family, hexuronate transporter
MTAITQTKIGKYRWTICGLIFFATTVNYLDRVVISLLKSDLTKEFNWTDGDYANIEIAFKAMYAIGMLGAGKLIDSLGTKLGYLLATLFWSLAAISHAFVTSTLGFIIARAGLGITEAGNFPAAIKATAEWFPKKERAFATGIFNSGATVGPVIAPLTVPFIAAAWGWQWAFIITGAMGFIWIAFWLFMYDSPSKLKKLSKPEFDYIHSDAESSLTETSKRISWFKLLGYRQTWAFVMGKFLTDPVWWFYLFWLPDFLQAQYALKGIEVSIPIALVYLISTVGGIGGGWLPMYMIKKNWPVFKARQSSMLIYAVLVVPIIFTQALGELNMWLAVFIIGLATAAHQAWSANIFTTVSDMFPKNATASVTGIGGMFGGLGGILLSLLVQKNMFVYYREIGQIETAYFIMFLICGSAYLLAWTVMRFLVPRMQRIQI